MAQYKHNFYGTSYYGSTNAFSGTYETETIKSDEALQGTANVTITSVLPQVEYLYTTEGFITTGTWTTGGTYIQSSQAGANIAYNLTASRVIVVYQASSVGAKVGIQITTQVPGQADVITNYTLDTVAASTSQQVYMIDNLAYGNQIISITLDVATTSTQVFAMKSIVARVADLTVEARARLGNGAWTAYAPVTLSKAVINSVTDGYTLTGTTASYTGNDTLQLRVWMATSDNAVTPTIQEIDAYAGNTSNRTPDAVWYAQVDMNAIATAATVTFKEVTSLDWNSTEPTGTTLQLTTRTTDDTTKASWSARSVLYTTSAKRLKLKESSNHGYLITPLINPASVNSFLRIDQWLSWTDSSFLPEDETSVKITYSFLDEQGTTLYRVDQPKYAANRSFVNTRIGNKPYRIRIDLDRRFDKASPAIDNISLVSTLIYEEKKVTENYGFSAVDIKNAGEKMILDMSTLTFNPPAEATAPTYYLEDRTERPLDVALYLDSTKALPASISRPNWTGSHLDKVWAKAKVNYTPNDAKATGVLKHYQYGGGTAVYQQVDETAMASSFTPGLKDNRKYRYFILPGWMNADSQTIVDGSINSAVALHWKTEDALADSAKLQVTEKSSHNAIINQALDTSSDAVMANVTALSTWGTVPWVSDEKIYFGTCNANDIRGDYIREHRTPDSGDSLDTTYVVQTGDTFESIAQKFGIDAGDIRELNNLPSDAAATVGVMILVPSRIVLPKIDPAAAVGSNPYSIDIVYNSVTSGGKTVADSRISRHTLKVITKEVTVEKEAVVRGNVVNGHDLLGSASVTQILGIWDLPNDPVIAPNYIEDTDYTLIGNQIDWGLAGGSSKEPTIGTTYYVSYKCMKPSSVIVTVGSDYQEEGGVDHIWRSTEVKEFSGTCSPGVDFKAELPAVSSWAGASDPNVQDIQHMIEDNDLWVKTWVSYDPATSKYYANGSLQDRIPKDNWFPYIRSGYYYTGKDEYYLFSEPTTYTPQNHQIPKGQNVTYMPARFNNGAKFQNASTNLLNNSGFATSTATSTVFWKGFNSTSIPTG